MPLEGVGTLYSTSNRLQAELSLASIHGDIGKQESNGGITLGNSPKLPTD